MYTGKRAKKRQPPPKATRPFRPPGRRRSQSSVIPGLLRQTATEKKVLFTGTDDATNGAQNCSTTGNVTCLNLIQVGSSMYNRIGRKVEMRSVRLTAQISTLNVTRATTTPDYYRVMLIYDRQTNGANPAMADFLQDTEQTGTNTTTSYSGLNMNNRERFVTIMDKKITLPQATCTAGVLTNVYPNDCYLPIKIDEFRKLRGLTTHYRADSNPAVIGDISTGSLLVLSVSLVAAGQDIWEFTWNARLKYVDV